MPLSVCIIGGGAAGFFCAINIAQKNPEIKITILEKTTKLLSKVSVSGGGRCNVTNSCVEVKDLVKNYPRGSKELYSVFNTFGPLNTVQWFKEKGIVLKTEADGRMFPSTDDSQTIINCFLQEAEKSGIEIRNKCQVNRIELSDDKIGVNCLVDDIKSKCFYFDAVVVTSGGFNQLKNYDFLSITEHRIIPPLPSLFTFNIPNNPITQLMGLSVNNAKIKILQSNFVFEGPLLITHWGFSGPAILKLSSFAADYLHQTDYAVKLSINWLNEEQNEVRSQLHTFSLNQHKSQVRNVNPFGLPRRLWEFLIRKIDVNETKLYQELSQKELNKMTEVLISDIYEMRGKTTFKEEFVTCGGVDLKEVNFKTMQSKKWKRLYFAGEILNIDGITGGFNFQAAWSTAWIAAHHIANNDKN